MWDEQHQTTTPIQQDLKSRRNEISSRLKCSFLFRFFLYSCSWSPCRLTLSNWSLLLFIAADRHNKGEYALQWREDIPSYNRKSPICIYWWYEWMNDWRNGCCFEAVSGKHEPRTEPWFFPTHILDESKHLWGSVRPFEPWSFSGNCFD